jgi:hypothetical protein
MLIGVDPISNGSYRGDVKVISDEGNANSKAEQWIARGQPGAARRRGQNSLRLLGAKDVTAVAPQAQNPLVGQSQEDT